MERKEQKLELLSPAGDPERLDSALRFGAGAVYLAGREFGMRAGPANFSNEELKKACLFAHEKGAKVYVTCNTLPRNGEIERLPGFLEAVEDAGADGLIVTDLGVLALAKRYAPRTEVHISTQAGIVNYQSARAFYDLGASRVVLARELSLEEIAEIRAKTHPKLELEAFVHGSMCVSFSGRCLLSNYLTGRDANRGDCAQPCRWKYHLMEEAVRESIFLCWRMIPERIFSIPGICAWSSIFRNWLGRGLPALKLRAGRNPPITWRWSQTRIGRPWIYTRKIRNNSFCPSGF